MLLFYKPEVIGRVLRALREDRKLTQKDVEKLTQNKVKASHLSQVELGEKGLRTERMQSLLAVYEIDEHTFSLRLDQEKKRMLEEQRKKKALLPA